MNNKTLPPHTIELVRHQLNHTPRQQWVLRWLALIGIILLVLIVATIVVIFDPELKERITWSDITRRMTDKNLIAQLMLGTIAAFFLFWQRKERLILDENGIRYISPLPQWLQIFRRSWQLEWGFMRRATLSPSKLSPRTDMSTLLLEVGLDKHKILPGQWVIRGLATNAAEQGSIWRNLNPRRYEVALQDTPVMRYFKALGIEVGNEAASIEGNHLFALEKHPHSLSAVLLFFIFSAYATADGLFIYGETYASQPLYWIYVGAGMLTALTSFLWLSRVRVPLLESTILATLIGGSIGIALYPGLLRINQLSDKNGLVVYEYVLQSDMSLKPGVTALPILRFDNYHEFWQHQGVGSLHNFQIRKGGLDFYQINMRPVREEMKIFYREKNAELVATGYLGTA